MSYFAIVDASYTQSIIYVNYYNCTLLKCYGEFKTLQRIVFLSSFLGAIKIEGLPQIAANWSNFSSTSFNYLLAVVLPNAICKQNKMQGLPVFVLIKSAPNKMTVNLR